ncbi:MAG: membrane protein insertase YidC [Nitrospirae bacterium]|nr:membrane protein insertase YidC [Nitrospirota bacterium]
MEKRTLIAVALSIVILVGWSYFFQPKPVPQKPASVEQTKPAEKSQTDQALSVPAPQNPEQISLTADSSGSDVTVETDLYKAVFSTKGAIVKSWQLKKYLDKAGMPVVLLKEPGSVPSLGILFESGDRNLPQNIIYTASKDGLILSKNGISTGEIVFDYTYQGISIKKKLAFYNDDYKIDLSIETLNAPSYMIVLGTNFGVFDKEQSEHKGPVLLADSNRKEFDGKLKETQLLTGYISWIAQEDKYFTAAIAPLTKVESAKVWKEGETAEIALKVSSQKQDFLFYAGPKEYDGLKKLNVGLEHIIDFGWFSIVAMPLFWVLKFFYKYLGNYGWTIILITIITRIPFIPLMHKSQQSMKKMQAIQPALASIKEQYKKDPQKMQKEMTELYKKHKVNPVGGCLPMLLQIPVFIALYNVLSKAIELRGAPFMFWIHDLSMKDPYYILPVVMGASMVFQQKITPSTMDPAQAKIMMIMPIVFTFMFLSFPSGLVIYWLVNNILGIAQQLYANKKAEA